MFNFVLWISTLFAFQPTPNILDGYVNKQSAFPGDYVDLYLNASDSSFILLTLDDLSGVSISTFPVYVFPQRVSKDKPWESGFGYQVTARVKVPDVKSGIYLWNGTIPL